MAGNGPWCNFFYGRFCLYYCLGGIPTAKVVLFERLRIIWELQNILVYLIVLTALAYLVKKFFLKIKKTNAAGCDTNCGCH
jgi:hypothetical protein